MPSETGHNLPGYTTSMQLTPYGIPQPGSLVVGGGGGVPAPFFRNLDDERRSMYRRTPEAEYPDGYLGTIQSRRADRLLDALKARTNERNYQRGVHKGERIDPSDYIWPEEFQPDNGLRAEAAGVKQAPIGLTVSIDMAESVLPAMGARLQATLNPVRQAQLRRLAPSWH